MSDAASLGYGEVVGQSDSGKSWLIKLDDLGERKMVPKKVIHDDSEVYDDENNSAGEVIVKQWWAEEYDLI